MIHVNLHKGYIAASSVYRTLPHLLSKWVSKLSFYLGCAKSQNLARLREIAKINTRKIIGIPKSQNFVLANNSNIKVLGRFKRIGFVTSFKATVRSDTVDGGWSEGERRERNEKERESSQHEPALEKGERQLKSAKIEIISCREEKYRFWKREEKREEEEKRKRRKWQERGSNLRRQRLASPPA